MKNLSSLTNLTKKALLEVAKNSGIKKVSTAMKKDDIIAAITKVAKEDTTENTVAENTVTENTVAEETKETNVKDRKEEVIMKKESSELKLMNRRGEVYKITKENKDNYEVVNAKGLKATISTKLVANKTFALVTDATIERYLSKLYDEKTANSIPNKFVKEEEGKHRFVLTISKGGSLAVIDNKEHNVYEVGVCSKFLCLLAKFFIPFAEEVKDKKYEEMDLLHKFSYKYFRKRK